MATTYNPLTGQMVTTTDPVKTTPNLSQFNNAAAPPTLAQITAENTANKASTAALASTATTTAAEAKAVAAVPTKDNTIFPKKGTVLGYREGQPGLRIPQIADGKGGYTFSAPEKDPDYKPTTTTGTFVATDGTKFLDQASLDKYQNTLNQNSINSNVSFGERVSAFALLKQEFERYGLGSLVGDIQKLATENLSADEFSLNLRQTTAYKNRFAANDQRIKAGLRALTESEYVTLEDSYQRLMRSYGLPESYYSKDAMGKQANLEQFIAGDVSPVEMEDRIQLAVNRVTNAPPETLKALTEFYPGITKTNLLAYVLDPQKALPLIQRQVQAAEIGGAAFTQGLTSDVNRAEQLAAAGVTKEAATQGYGTIGGGLQRGSELAAIYGQGPYTQTTAESEIFNLAGSTDAAKQRKKITGLEKATFGGQTGLTSGALARDRAGVGQY